MGSLELAERLEDFQLIITLCLLFVPYWFYISPPLDYISDFSILYPAKEFIG